MLWIILLYAGGISLVLAEFLLPGGILGIFGAVFLVGSAGLTVYYYPGEAFWIITVQLLGLFLSDGLPGRFVFTLLAVGLAVSCTAAWFAVRPSRTLRGIRLTGRF